MRLDTAETQAASTGLHSVQSQMLKQHDFNSHDFPSKRGASQPDLAKAFMRVDLHKKEKEFGKLRLPLNHPERRKEIEMTQPASSSV